MTVGEMHLLTQRFNRITQANVAQVTRDAWLCNLQSDIESMYGGNKMIDTHAVAMHQAITEERVSLC